ncbi:hypothetical protein NE237_016208 [Protea cynaroides]|uniref:Uncharacterized protein n=1 Tax=Protea cynaroides TaxID=273540 RepID=A0A9Q0QRS2_9MAGN|nr:hypothetical protein NE237_016208 [Protea cynaroides]
MNVESKTLNQTDGPPLYVENSNEEVDGICKEKLTANCTEDRLLENAREKKRSLESCKGIEITKNCKQEKLPELRKRKGMSPGRRWLILDSIRLQICTSEQGHCNHCSFPQ